MCYKEELPSFINRLFSNKLQINIIIDDFNVYFDGLTNKYPPTKVKSNQLIILYDYMHSIRLDDIFRFKNNSKTMIKWKCNYTIRSRIDLVLVDFKNYYTEISLS